MKLYSLRRGSILVLHRFTEMGQIFQNVSGPQEVDFESPKYYLWQNAPDPSRSFRLRHLFRKSVTIYPRSVPESGTDFFVIYGFLSLCLLVIISIILGSSSSSHLIIKSK